MSRRSRLIDPVNAWTNYWQMGDGHSLDKMQAANPIVNPRTGKLVTRDAIEKSMWRWACRPENYESAYSILKTALMSQGDLWTRERFSQELREKARWALTRRQYINWYEPRSS